MRYVHLDKRLVPGVAHTHTLIKYEQWGQVGEGYRDIRKKFQCLALRIIILIINKYFCAKPGHMPLWLRGPDAIYVQRLSAVTHTMFT